jgi:hypothetical protein
MTVQEKHAVLGKAHAELKAKKEELDFLRLAAYQLGEDLKRLGFILSSQEPERAFFNGASVPVQIVPTGKAVLFERTIFDADKFLELTEGIRQAMLSIKDMEERLAPIR